MNRKLYCIYKQKWWEPSDCNDCKQAQWWDEDWSPYDCDYAPLKEKEIERILQLESLEEPEELTTKESMFRIILRHDHKKYFRISIPSHIVRQLELELADIVEVKLRKIL